MFVGCRQVSMRVGMEVCRYVGMSVCGGYVGRYASMLVGMLVCRHACRHVGM